MLCGASLCSGVFYFKYNTYPRQPDSQSEMFQKPAAIPRNTFISWSVVSWTILNGNLLPVKQTLWHFIYIIRPYLSAKWALKLNPLAPADPHLSGHTALGCEAVSTPPKCTISDGGGVILRKRRMGEGEGEKFAIPPCATLSRLFRPEVMAFQHPPLHPSRSSVSWKSRCPWQQLIWPRFLQGEPGLFLKLHLSLIQLGKENIQCAESSFLDLWDQAAILWQPLTLFQAHFF